MAVTDKKYICLDMSHAVFQVYDDLFLIAEKWQNACFQKKKKEVLLKPFQSPLVNCIFN